MSVRSTPEIARVALFAALIGLGALVAIPFVGPVPFTLQPLVVLLTGMVLGPRLAPVSVLVYLTLGLVAPVYAGGQAGIGVLIGPTGGYLVGFVLAAWVAGVIAHRGRPTFARYAVAGLAGLIPVYVLGAMWLAMHLELTSVWGVLVTGVLQFLPLDVMKALLAAGLAGALVSSPLGLPGLRRDR
ncbi:MAG: biotin transporter BioY [Actinomycetota bacterium]|nr:MAG: biotin transporter BioY [Actinomycetota bacterium]